MTMRRNWMPAHHFYICRCETCPWCEVPGQRPLAARQRAMKHARRKPGHRTCTINVSRLEVATTHHFEPLPDVSDAPPF